MIVFDLQCGSHAHVFEAWFGSSDDYADQQERGLLACPICGDVTVSKAVMAPNVSAKGNARRASTSSQTVPVVKPDSPTAPEAKAMLAVLAKVQSEMLAKSTWVGRKFDSQARAMDAGEAPKASIYGEVTAQEAKALVEDGIGVMPLPLPVTPPEKLN